MALIGVTVRGERIEDTLHLRLDRPVTVLYGVNGSGKTSTLTRICSLFSRARVERWNRDRARWFSGIHIHVDEDTGDLPALADDIPYSVESTELILRNCMPKVCSTFDASILAAELHSSRCLTFGDVDSGACWSYRDFEAPTWRAVRDEATRVSRELWEADPELYVDLAVDGERLPGREYERELLWYVCPDMSLFGAPQPDWLPHQTKLCSFSSKLRPDLHLRSFSASEERIDLDQATASALAEMPTDEIPEALGDLEEWARDTTATWSAEATVQLRMLLPDGPSLRVIVGRGRDWLKGPITRWEAHDALQDRWIPLAQLSTAQLRLAGFGVEFVLSGAPKAEHESEGILDPVHLATARERSWIEAPKTDGGTMAAIDEPERGLHSLAQRQMAQALPLLADHVIVATHSPAVLDLHEHVYHVQRSPRGLSAHELAPLCRAGLEESWARELGLSVTELIQLVRTIVLVEGKHDAMILEALIGEEVRMARGRIVSLDGTHNLSHVAEARWLFDFTTAQLVVVLDDLDGAAVGSALMNLEEAVRRGIASGSALDAFRRRLGRSQGGQVLTALATACVEQGRISRLRACGLRKKDILEYLPVKEFVPGAESWVELFRKFADECRQDRRSISGSGYKAWLRKQGAAIEVDGIERVLRRIAEGVVSLEPEDRSELEAISDTIAGSSIGLGS